MAPADRVRRALLVRILGGVGDCAGASFGGSGMQVRQVSSGLFLLIALLTVANAIFRYPPLGDAAIVALFAFLVMEFPRIPRTQRKVGMVLTAAGILAALGAEAPFDSVHAGLRRTLPFLVLFASIGWLQLPSSHSPSLLAIRESVLRQRPGKRYAAVAVAAHFLGVTFNLAGLSLLTPMVRQGTEPHLQERLGRAMVQGFGAGSCWSPFFVGTAFVLAAVPGVEWSAVGPVGLAIAMVLLVWSWLIDRLFAHSASPSSPSLAAASSVSDTLPGLAIRNAVLISITLFACVIALVEGMNWSIPIALAVTAPGYAMAWSFFIHRAGAGVGPGETARTVLSGYAALSGETILFTGANVLGSGLSSILAHGAVERWIGALAGSPNLALVVIMGGYGTASALGLHPVVSVVLITSLTTPDALGLPPGILALALMVMWGQGTNTSPFSATSLYMARVTGMPGWAVAWRWNGLHAVSTTILLTALLLGLKAMNLF